MRENTIRASASRENPSSFVIRTRIMFVHPFGDYTLPGDPFSPLTRKLCRYPGADVRAISEILQHATWCGREGGKEGERGWKREQERERGGGTMRTGTARVALRHENARAEGTRWEGMQSMWRQTYSDEIYIHTTGILCRDAREYIYTLISFPQPANFFFRARAETESASVAAS